jgi:acyl-CoA thioester hydrolase
MSSPRPPRPASGSRAPSPPFPDLWFETRVRVRYAETDKMGVVYYGNYFTWFEIGRTDLCRQCGFSYRDMERERDAYLMVVSASCTYRRPAVYDDDLVVETRIATFARRTMSFEYRVVHADTHELLAEGATAHVVTTSDGRVRAFPTAEAALIEARLKERAATVRVDTTPEPNSSRVEEPST